MSSLDNWEWDYPAMKKVEEDLDEYMGDLYTTLMDTPEEEPDTLSGFPFCGCDTCVTRETLSLLMPAILDAYLDGAIRSVPLQHGDGNEPPE